MTPGLDGEVGHRGPHFVLDKTFGDKEDVSDVLMCLQETGVKRI